MSTTDKPGKPGNPFESAIRRYLDQRAAEDPQFAQSYANPSKNISQCCAFIISEVRKTKRTAFTNDEIYGLAVHYYDEANLGEISDKANCRVVVPDEPKAQKATSSSPRPAVRKSKPVQQDLTPSLFDF